MNTIDRSLCALALACLQVGARAQELVPTPGDLDGRAPLFDVPDLTQLVAAGMRDVIERYETDRSTLDRFYDARYSELRGRRQAELASAWGQALQTLPFDELKRSDQIDYLLFDSELRHALKRIELARERRAEGRELLPFGDAIVELQERRRRLEALAPQAAAQVLVELTDAVGALQGRVVARAEGTEVASESIVTTRIIANRAAGDLRDLRRTLGSWYRYRADYDPLFTWWVKEPFEALDRALEDYGAYLREDVAGIAEDDRDTILGDPIGRAALLAELAHEWIPYTPERLVEIAEAEFAWCDREMQIASEELGFGEDWRAAQEHVKTKHVAPGEQPEMIRMLAFEAVDFLERKELLTIPPLAKNSWRMEMMSPARQKYTPYFTGGEVISVSYPTAEMRHEDKLMSMRGNNLHFSRATVHHELIPGHHLQQFMNARYKRYRRMFRTPFWSEGWALYWEMLLWDEGFPQSAEDRVGMLFWRKHRCARIIFSLNFQLGEWTPEQCVDFLVERVGHERRNATAEVRRSVQGGYGPLYQAAYMLGGLQLRALQRDLVGRGRLTNRAFHDAVLRENSIPVELVRASLGQNELTRETRSTWRFYDE